MLSNVEIHLSIPFVSWHQEKQFMSHNLHNAKFHYIYKKNVVFEDFFIQLSFLRRVRLSHKGSATLKINQKSAIFYLALRKVRVGKWNKSKMYKQSTQHSGNIRIFSIKYFIIWTIQVLNKKKEFRLHFCIIV